ncbi:trypsin 5G1-like [Hyposmocoma kahamanoa]|uniref:trypsin 5G1-like n=1 Tax=Hyposmocoma kahamanoa TaxID=1477025 RepID=UPI000E6D7F1B|nr:trypsin 5G1-like [Hyposmocoma kahamanoa]
MDPRRQKTTIRQTKASMEKRASRAPKRLDLRGAKQRGVERGEGDLSPATIKMYDDVERVSWCPFMVSLKQNIKRRIKLCGGTILTDTLTLTAAHCVIFGVTGLYLQFGSTYVFGGRMFEATNITLHNFFDRSAFAHDIGLVSIFPAKLSFGLNVLPVKLPKKNLDIESTSWLRIYGWGATSEHQSFSEILLSTMMPLVDEKICKSLLDNVPENTFCLGYFDGHVDACLGDSGGPAMLLDVQVGITSFGEGCALPLKPGVYTDVRKYIDWLHGAMKTLH